MSQRRCQWITKSLGIIIKKKTKRETKLQNKLFLFFWYEACPIISCSTAEAVSSWSTQVEPEAPRLSAYDTFDDCNEQDWLFVEAKQSWSCRFWEYNEGWERELSPW